MKTLLHFISCFAVLGSLSAREPYHTHYERKFNASKQTKLQRHVRAYMDTVIFPRVLLSHVPLAEAVNWVMDHVSEYASASTSENRRGIGITLRPRQGVQEFVSVSLQSATLPQVLDAVCKQHHYV